MKKTSSFKWSCVLAAAGLTLCAGLASAQNGTTTPIRTNAPVVIIRATDASASENGDPGQFTVYRGDMTNGDLVVWLQVGGSASNGVDYATIGNTVTIPDGQRSAVIPVTPMDDPTHEPLEYVVVRVVPSPLLSPVVQYLVGSPYSATVSIADNDGTVATNRPPVVNIVAPGNNTRFIIPVNIGIAANAYDPDGSVVSVEFFANDHSLGVRNGSTSNTAPAGTVNALFSLVWSNVPLGEYNLTAKATDNRGAKTTSPIVRILVTTNTPPPPPPPPPTNQPTLVTIVASDPHASEGLVMWYSNTVVGIQHPTTNNLCRTNLTLPTGTNNAAFTVRRSGSTSNDLRVYYAIGGRASNGVDYATLPGVVTISAGQRQAIIPVVPIDDTLPEPTESVALRLLLPPLPLAAGDSPYTIGRPGEAAAFIVDNDRPAPNTCRLPDGMFHICEPITNRCFRVDISTNLVHWESICTNSVTDGMARHIDPAATNHAHRYYRLVPVPCPTDQP